MVPLTRRTLYVDLFQRWGAPVVLVARTSLGTINHSLLSIEALRTRDIPILGIVFSGEPMPDKERPSARSGASAAGPRAAAPGSTGTRCWRLSRRSSTARFSVPPSVADLSPLWHPFTQHATSGPMIEIVRAEGAWLEAPTEGDPGCDFVVVGQYARPRSSEDRRRDRRAASRLEQVIFAGFTHPPAERLARKLLAIAPKELEFVFLSDPARRPWRSGSRWRSATGTTWAGRAIGSPPSSTPTTAIRSGRCRSGRGAAYRRLPADAVRSGLPAVPDELGAADVEARASLRDHEGEIAALIVEPLAGAAGMLVYPAWLLTELAALCRRHDVFLIADEVMTGFGRTGTLFACEQAGVVPDVMCLSKGITGASADGGDARQSPLYEAFWSADRGPDVLPQLVLHRQRDRLRRRRRQPGDLGERAGAADPGDRTAQCATLPAFRDRDAVADVRACGTIAAI